MKDVKNYVATQVFLLLSEGYHFCDKKTIE